MRVQLGRASHILEQDMWTVIVHSISVVSKRESKNIERVVGRLSFRRSSPSLRVMHNDMDHNKSPDIRKALKAHRPLIPAYSFTQKWWRGTIEAEGPRCAFFPVGSICLALHSSGWKVFVLQRVVLFRSRASSGTQTNHIWRSFWYFGLIFQRRLFPRKWKRVWKCLFPVWKQRLRDTQIFRRITNNRFMQVSCKVFTALRHESRGTEEN